MSTNTSLKNYVPTRQVCKPDLIRIARALGLVASEKERTRALVERCVNAAERLRRDLELSQARRPTMTEAQRRTLRNLDLLMKEWGVR